MFLINTDYRDDQSGDFIATRIATEANLPRAAKWKDTKTNS